MDLSVLHSITGSLRDLIPSNLLLSFYIKSKIVVLSYIFSFPIFFCRIFLLSVFSSVCLLPYLQITPPLLWTVCPCNACNNENYTSDQSKSKKEKKQFSFCVYAVQTTNSSGILALKGLFDVYLLYRGGRGGVVGFTERSLAQECTVYFKRF